MLKEYLSTIANTIRLELGVTDKINAQDFSGKISEVYTKGDDAGFLRANVHVLQNNYTGDYVIPYGITNLRTFCFAYSSIYSIYIPDSVKIVSNGAFQYCTNLRSVRYPKAEILGANLFVNCSNLTSLTFVDPTGYTLSAGNLTGCGKLTTIIFESGMLTDSWYLQNSPISVESMKHIIEHLTDYSGTENEGKYTVRFSDTCWDALENESSSPNGNTWKDYVNALGWNI